MGRSSVTEEFIRNVGTFAVLGPAAGVGAIWVFLIAIMASTGDDGAWDRAGSLPLYLAQLVGAVLLTLVVGYVIGIIPAVVTGIICHLFARSIRSHLAWIGLSAAVGAASGAVAAAVLLQGWPDGRSLGFLALPGAVAAATCAFKLRRQRWASPV